MRARFVVASVVAHVGVVCLAFQTARVAKPELVLHDVVEQSGLVRVELNPPSADVSPQTAEEPPIDDPKKSAANDEALSAPTPQALDVASPKRPRETSKPGVTQPESPVRATAAQPRSASQTTSTPTPQAAEDWLSIDQQLPEQGTKSPEPRAERPARDELVERLLAKDREKQAVERRQEFARTQAAQRAAEASSAAPRVSAGSPPDVGGGENHDSADTWVELTRWLPRAASSDPSWETLASDTRFDVSVRVRRRVDSTLDVSAVGEVPEIVARLLRTTAHLMQRGRFASGPPERLFTLRIRLSRTVERELWIAHTTPDPPKPGVGSFVSASGRRFDVWVAAEP